MNTYVRMAIASASLCALSATASLATPYTSFFMLGDSLSDPGNLFEVTENVTGTGFPPPPYNQRFTNDRTWAEVVADEFAVSENYAFGGARAVTNSPEVPGDATTDNIPDLNAQVGLLTGALPGAALGLSTPKLTIADGGANPLTGLWFGANDLFGTLTNNPLDAAQRKLDAEAAANAVADTIGGLFLALGLDDFLVFNVPDLGLTPSYQLNLGGLQSADATAAAQDFNSQLGLRLDQLRLLGINIIEINPYDLLQDLDQNPGTYGVTNVDAPCLWVNELADDRPDTTLPFCGADVADFAYFDGVHPTSTIHNGIAQVVLRELNMAAVPVPATASLMLLALAGFGVMRRRKS